MEKLVIFDLDGTLLDTIKDIKNALNKALHNLGFNANYTKEEVASFVGSGVIKLATRALRKFNISDEETILKLKDEYNKIYSNNSNVYTKPFDGVKEMLRKLKKENMKLVVFSNKPDQDSKFVINNYFEEGTFDIVRGQLEGIKIKPSPEGVIKILEKYPQIEKENIYYVGDSDIDMETGINANLKTIGVTWGYRKKEILESYNPFKIVSTIRELTNVLI